MTASPHDASIQRAHRRAHWTPEDGRKVGVLRDDAVGAKRPGRVFCVLGEKKAAMHQKDRHLREWRSVQAHTSGSITIVELIHLDAFCPRLTAPILAKRHKK